LGNGFRSGGDTCFACHWFLRNANKHSWVPTVIAQVSFVIVLWQIVSDCIALLAGTF
jgi:hypothetical protein